MPERLLCVSSLYISLIGKMESDLWPSQASSNGNISVVGNWLSRVESKEAVDDEDSLLYLIKYAGGGMLLAGYETVCSIHH